MMEFALGVVVGAVVMDLLWAWRLGIPQRLWQRWQQRRDPRPDYRKWSED